MDIHANGIAHHLAVLGPQARAGEARPAFVFLHYFGGSGESWDEVVRGIDGRARCIAPDLRGFGDTGAPGSGYAIDDYANDIAALVETLGLSDYVLVGHSMGGKIALALAARRLAGLRALLLVAPSPPVLEPMAEEERARLLATHGSRQAALETIGKAVHRPLPPARLERAVRDNLRSSPAAWRAWLERGSREDISACMGSIEVPVTVLLGRNDRVMPRVLMQREVADAVGGILVIASDAGHLLPLETPQVVVHALRGFLEAAPPAPRYPAGTTRALVGSDLVTPPTREALAARLAPGDAASRFLTGPEYAVLRAACARLIPHPAAPKIAAAIDHRLAEGRTDGWRYDDMPPDPEACRLGLRGLDESARAMFGAGFATVDGEAQDRVLAAVQRGAPPGAVWETLAARRFFEEFLTECAEAFYSEAAGQDDIGYAGFADTHGWQGIGLGDRAPHEPQPLAEDRDA